MTSFQLFSFVCSLKTGRLSPIFFLIKLAARRTAALSEQLLPAPGQEPSRRLSW